MYDFVKDNDAKLSTHLQKNLNKKYKSTEKLLILEEADRPKTSQGFATNG